MIKKIWILLAAGLGLGVLLGGFVLLSGANSQQGPVVGQKVDDFQLQELSGSSLHLSQYQGKVVILNFWATWCAPCNEEMPLLQKYSDEFSDKVVVIGVNSQEQASEVQKYITSRQIHFLVGIDLSGEITRKFLVNGYPTTFFIDTTGILRAMHIGALRDDLLRGYLQTLGVNS